VVLRWLGASAVVVVLILTLGAATASANTTVDTSQNTLSVTAPPGSSTDDKVSLVYDPALFGNQPGIRVMDPGGVTPAPGAQCFILNTFELHCVLTGLTALHVALELGTDFLDTSGLTTALVTIAVFQYLMGPGRDQLLGGDHDEWVWGGSGRDRLDRGGGNDVAYGQGGGDVLRPSAGNDREFGGSGNDQVHGGPGRDLLNGGSGSRDTCNGGSGNDKDRNCERGPDS
jgi:RTX calcium-binding nonapeptide repeat (4 copies)